MNQDLTIRVSSLLAVMSPYALGRLSRQMFRAARDYKAENEVPIVKYYLFSASIELGMKSAILAVNCTNKNKIMLKNKINHNLEAAHMECCRHYDMAFLHDGDLDTIRRINRFYKNKGLEYYSDEMLAEMLRAFSSLPEIGALMRSCEKIQDFLEMHKYFIDINISDESQG